MDDLDFSIPDDFLLGLALARRFAQFLVDEKARTGLTEQQIIEKAGGTFRETDVEQNRFLNSLKDGDIGHDLNHKKADEVMETTAETSDDGE